MKLTIFYSWQTQTDTKYNKNFINSCLEKAVKQLKNFPLLNNVKFEIIEGVRDKPGSPPVAWTITEESIRRSDIFIADVSVTNYKKPFWPSWIMKLFSVSMLRPMVNNNVMVEYGVAMAKLGTERIISVSNSVYGSPKENVENLPFDIRALRFPIEYNYDKSSTERDSVQKALIEDFKKAIRTVAIHALEHYKTQHKPFLSWEGWQSYIPQHQKFISNGKIEEIYESLKKASKEGNRTIRILGLSGLGKTRIIFELFRPLEDDESKKFSGSALYFDCNANTDTNIIARVEDILRSDNEYLIVLDNCPADICRSLKTRIKQNAAKVTLITIDSNPEESEQNRIDGVDYIIINKDDLKSVVDEIIKIDFADLPPDSVEKIKDFSQGIPMMAVLLGDSARKGERFIGKLEDKDLLEKLLGVYGQEQEVKTLLKTGSLFNYFGYEGEMAPQLKFLATNSHLTVTNNQPNVSEQLFLDIIKHYLARQIFEKKGRLVGMRPFPLAIHLAAEWLDQCTDERLLNLIKALDELEHPHGKQLADALAEQMKFLGFSPKAKSLIEQIVARDAPFDNAEVLNTELGSRLFRAFVQVNPIATSKAVTRIFGAMDFEKLRKIEEGRRNLVWSLQTLCFDQRTFSESAKVLSQFAIAENETWSNNATGSFLHLFSIHLSGTEATLEARIEIINWMLNNPYNSFKKLALQAMSRALSFGHFSRMGGAEKQGSKTLKDNVPTEGEILNYWNAIIEFLGKLYDTESELKTMIEDIVLDKLRQIASAGMAISILDLIEDIALAKDFVWDKAIRPLKTTLKYEIGTLHTEDIFKLKSILSRLIKDDFISKFNRIIVDPHIDFIENFSYETKENEIFKLAQEFTEQNIDLQEIVPMLAKGYAYSASSFGKSLYNVWKDDFHKLETFIDVFLYTLEHTERSIHNISILEGIYQVSNVEQRKTIFDKIRAFNSLSYLLFWLTPLSKTAFDETEELFELVDKGGYSITEFIAFSRNGYIDFDSGKLKELCKELFRYGKDGYMTAYKIAQTATFFNEKRTNDLLPILRETILKIGILNQDRGIDRFQWLDIIRKILLLKNDDEFARQFNKAIIDSMSWENNYHLDNSIQNVYEILMTKYFNIVWPLISENLIGTDESFVKFYSLKHILGSSNGSLRHTKGILFLGDINTIFKWAAENIPEAPIRLAALSPIYEDQKDYDNTQWHQVSKRLIDEFGDDVKVLMELEANMGSFSWTGSIIPYLKMQKNLMHEIAGHKNPVVVAWSSSMTAELDRRIEIERNRDEEYDIR
jgi:hypothetical protein